MIFKDILQLIADAATTDDVQVKETNTKTVCRWVYELIDAKHAVDIEIDNPNKMVFHYKPDATYTLNINFNPNDPNFYTAIIVDSEGEQSIVQIPANLVKSYGTDEFEKELDAYKTKCIIDELADLYNNLNKIIARINRQSTFGLDNEIIADYAQEKLHESKTIIDFKAFKDFDFKKFDEYQRKYPLNQLMPRDITENPSK